MSTQLEVLSSAASEALPQAETIPSLVASQAIAVADENSSSPVTAEMATIVTPTNTLSSVEVTHSVALSFYFLGCMHCYIYTTAYM